MLQFDAMSTPPDDRPPNSHTPPDCLGSPAECARRRRDKEATKQALLVAAMQVFAAHGYDAATTREIAARAGSNEQLIQRYFGGKNGLLLAVLERFGSAEQQACTLPPPQGGVAEEIAGFLAFHLRHGWACRDFLKVALGRAMVDPEIAAEMARLVTASRVPCLRQRLEGLRAQGEIAAEADLEAVATALASLSFSLGFIDQVVFGRAAPRTRAVAESLAQVIAAGLAPGACAEPTAADRLPTGMKRQPKIGEDVSWQTSQGETHGKVVRKLTATMKIKGHVARASKDAPEFLVESAKSGKRAAHKAAALKKA
jgi:AcrR family transcriptional regulator